VQSKAVTPDEIGAELQAASADAKPFRVDLSAVASPHLIELRFANDLWAGQGKPGDRNLFIKSVKVNGQLVPNSRLHIDNRATGYTDGSGTSMYNNGSLWVNGPFVDGCV
ncbi:carbohydrate-binding domain-containing protein, partial [Mesorhizobium sp. M4A.F.Ca.ET.022.05.2.1]